MHKRKAAKQQQTGAAAGRAGDTLPAATPSPSAAPNRSEQQQQAAAEDRSPRQAVQDTSSWHSGSWLQGATAVLAVAALVYSHHAAVRLLSPQTGEWLAASFCSLAVFAVALVAAVAGHAAQEAVAALGMLRLTSSSRHSMGSRDGINGSSSSSVTVLAALGWCGASFSALALSIRWDWGSGSLLSSAGSWVLAPGLADDPALRLADAELTLRAMALSAVTCGALFAALGFAAGASASAALRAQLTAATRVLLLLLLLAATAGWAMLRGLPPAMLPPRPAASLPPAIAAVAAAVAAALLPNALLNSESLQKQPQPSTKQQKSQHKRWPRGAATQRNSSSRRTSSLSIFTSRRLAAAMALVAALAAAQLAKVLLDQPCSTSSRAPRELEGGRHSVLWQCEAAAGGKLAVVEGTYKEKYRYRLLRMDHSVLGGEYVAPADVAGQPIYTAFYLQQAAVLLRPNGTRSLHIGLGVGAAVKGMQRLGVAADTMELHPEVLQAARSFFGLQPQLLGGQALVGDAAVLVPQLRRQAAVPQAGQETRQYDYILHDVFSGGGAPQSLMGPSFFRQLSGLLAPGGVLAVNYYGGKGMGLKQAWCRLRLVFDSVRAFSDVEQARVRNHVLFASYSDLAAANLTEALQAVLSAAAARAATAAAANRDSSGGEGAAEVLDPLQLRVWGALPQQEVKYLYDRQRCQQMLMWQDGLPAGRPGGGARSAPGSGKEPAPAGKLRGQPPWLWRKAKQMRETHALATAHWVVARMQFADSLWLS